MEPGNTPLAAGRFSWSWEDSRAVLPPVFGCKVFLTETDCLGRFPRQSIVGEGASRGGLGEGRRTEPCTPFFLPPCLQTTLPLHPKGILKSCCRAIFPLCSLPHGGKMPAPSLASHSAPPPRPVDGAHCLSTAQLPILGQEIHTQQSLPGYTFRPLQDQQGVGGSPCQIWALCR